MYIVKIVRHKTKETNVFSANNFSAHAREISVDQGGNITRVPLESLDKVYVTEGGNTIESWVVQEDQDNKTEEEKKD